jgi:hypothetical protein
MPVTLQALAIAALLAEFWVGPVTRPAQALDTED